MWAIMMWCIEENSQDSSRYLLNSFNPNEPRRIYNTLAMLNYLMNRIAQSVGDFELITWLDIK